VVVSNRGDAVGSAFRSDIEGLRAIAVLLVVIYHARLEVLEGGLVGVDVFFVLSGFLITSLLLREIDTEGRVSLANFWARRVRRLLPASTATVLVTLVAAHWMLAPLELRSLARDAVAAAGFVINFVFMWRSNDYFAGDSAATSPLLHFWSLALEEQFYVVWPVIFALLARFRNPRRAAAPAIGVLVVGSFIAGWWFTGHEPVAAFYLLPTRAWELGVGALLATGAANLGRVPSTVRMLLGWGGLAGIVVSAVIINDQTPFPGYAALLPVLATAALIISGSAPARWSPARLLSVRPLQWIGKRSYSIYLWHWPAYILATSRWGSLNNWQAITTMAVAMGVAAIAYQLIENPFRHDAWLAVRPQRPLMLGLSLVAATIGIAVMVIRDPIAAGSGTATAPTLAVPSTADSPIGPEQGSPDTIDPDQGPSSSTATTAPGGLATTSMPGALIESLITANRANVEASLETTRLPSNLTPDPRTARPGKGQISKDGCVLANGVSDLGDRTCVYGNPDSETKITIIGDSHASHWFPALESLAKARNWRLLFLVKAGCLPEDVNRFRDNWFRRDCIPWRENILERIRAEQPDVLLISHYRYNFRRSTYSERSGRSWQGVLTDFFTKVTPLAGTVVLLEDVPTPGVVVPSCLLRYPSSIGRCNPDRSIAADPKVRAAERSAAEESGVHYVETADWFCDETRCAVTLGSLLVYADESHLTVEAAQFFEPFLGATLGPIVDRTK